jgi:histidyl-tRNA synthetase
VRYKANPLRILDCKNEKCRTILAKAPSLSGMICEKCRTHLQETESLLKASHVEVRRNDKLVRGLDYYTGTIFEVVSRELGAQNAVCGGGRYDSLVGELGGSDIPAVGMAIGLERLIEVMRLQKLLPEKEQGVSVYIAALGQEAQKTAFAKMLELLKEGIGADMDLSGKSLKSQLKAADNLGAKYVLMIGEDELKKNAFPLRDMKTGEQKEIKIEDLFREIEPTC